MYTWQDSLDQVVKYLKRFSF